MSRNFGTHMAENFPMSKCSWMMGPTRWREMPSCSAVDLAKIRRSSKISSWIWSIISGVVTVLGHPGRGASQVEKSSCLNWATQFLWCHTMVHVPQMFLSAWREFPLVPCLLGKKTWWQLVSRCCWNRACYLTCFLLVSNKKTLAIRHINGPLFATTLSIPSYDMGK